MEKIDNQASDEDESSKTQDVKPKIDIPDKPSRNSEDEFVEIRTNYSVKKSTLTKPDIDSLIVKCTSCRKQINHHDPKRVKRHPHLKVLICKDCLDFYGNGEFSQDEDGDKYCRWCAQGGILFACDYCSNTFCQKCVRYNFGRGEVKKIETESKWTCYVCEPKILAEKINFCNLLFEYSENTLFSNKKKVTLIKFHEIEDDNKVSPQNWLPVIIERSISLSKQFQKRMEKLKHIMSKPKSKSYKQILKKIEQMTAEFRIYTKRNISDANKKYEEYLKHKIDETKLNSNDTENLKFRQSVSDTLESILNRISVGDPEKLNKNIIQDSHKSDSFVEIMEKSDSKSKGSSDSDVHSEKSVKKCASPSAFEAKPIELSGNLSEEEVICLSSSESDFNNKKSKTKIKKKVVDTSSSSDSSSFNSSLDEKLTHKKKLIRKKIFTKEQISKWNENKKDRLEHDKKLNEELKPVVLVKKLEIPKPQCDEVLDYYKKKKKKDDDLTKMEKSVNRLLFGSKRKHQTSLTEMKPPEKKVKKSKGVKLSSTSEDFSLGSSDADSDEEKKPDMFGSSLPDATTKASNCEDDSNVSDCDIDTLLEDNKSKNKKSKPEKKTSSESDNSVVSTDKSSDDDDFVVKKRSKKDEKLRKAANELLKDGSKKKEKSTKGKGKQKRKKVIYSDDSSIENSKDSDEDSSQSSSDSDFQQRKKKNANNKRKRVKIDNSSDNSDEPKPDSQSTPGKGRKNIRKVISDKSLQDETREAQLMEKERIKRVQERQKLYNRIVEDPKAGKDMITKKLVLEVDSETKEELVEIHPDIIEKLKPHQVNGVKFMWEATIESIKELETKPGSGCILAHCMGLGKTLQVIAFLFTILTNKRTKKHIKTAMVVCPNNTVLNWSNEFDTWLESCGPPINVFEMIQVKDYSSRLELLKNWQNDGGVLILGYEAFARLVDGKIPRKNKAFKEKVFQHVANPGPDIIVCDEGHKLKNEKSQLGRCAGKIRTLRRIILTGTPLQNNLKEYYCMMNFVKPHLLGTFKEFTNRFVNPITNGQYDDSSKHDVKLMKKRVHILHKLLEGCVQRCDYSALTKFLPPKHEFVISVKLSDLQVKLYRAYLDQNPRDDVKDGVKRIDGRLLFPDYSFLKNIWTFPYALRLSHNARSKRELIKDNDLDEEGNLKDFIDDDSSSDSASSDADLEIIDEQIAGPSKKTRSKKRDLSSEDEVIKSYPRPSPEPNEESGDDEKLWFNEYFDENDRLNPELGGKIALTLEILKAADRIGDKILIFSTSLITLDIIEMFLEAVHNNSALLHDNNDTDVRHTWVHGLDYFRMDGKTNVDIRQKFMQKFNRTDNSRARLFLISTRAGSLGTNLTGANRVILFDASWNPSDDVQSIFRVYRFGQTKPVYIYRLLAQGTMEEKIYNRQVTKLSMSCRVVDEQNIDRHFNQSDLAELYNFEPNDNVDKKVLMVPNDRLLADLIISHRDWIINFFEHDSLLQSTTEDELTEEERQAAWTEYENEKEGLFQNNFDDGLQFKSDKFAALGINDAVKIICNDISSKFPHLSRFDFLQKVATKVGTMKAQCQLDLVQLLRVKQEFVSKGVQVPTEIKKSLERVQRNTAQIDTIVNNIQSQMSTEIKKMNTQNQTGQTPFTSGAQIPNPRFPRMPNQNFASYTMPNSGLRPGVYSFNMPQAKGNFQPKNPAPRRPVIVDITNDDGVSGNVNENIPMIDVEPVVTFSEEYENENKNENPKPKHTVQIMEVE